MERQGIDHMLAQARRRLRRLTAAEADDAVRRGAMIVDTRPESQRGADGEIPGAVVIERSQLEWRLDPGCPHRIREAVSHDIHWIVVCDEGYSSSLAALSLKNLGLDRATDLIGGFRAWRDSGLPVVRPDRPTAPRGPSG